MENLIPNFEEVMAKLEAAEASMTPEERARRDERERARQEERKREELNTKARRLVAAGVPVKDVRRVLAGSMEQTSPLGRLSSPESGERLILALSGPPGIGKTTAAAWWLLEGHRRSSTDWVQTTADRFVTAAELARWPRYDEGRMRDLSRARALVIDDLGVEYADKRGAFTSMVDEVINLRYGNELPTLITTNLPGAEFKARYGERLADRIREVGEFMELPGESLRRKARQR